MKPINTCCTNAILVAAGCEDLPVYKGDDYIVSFWKPSIEELAAINAGIPIKLTLLGNSLPPLAIEVESL